MKFFLFISIVATSLLADHINKETLACPSIKILKSAPLLIESDPTSVSMFTIANSCRVLSKSDHVEVLEYDPNNSKTLFYKVIYSKTNETLFVRSSAVTVEQGGKKNSIRF